MIASWAATADAQITSTWNTTTGVYTYGPNWHNDIVPGGAGDTAVFDREDTFTVTGFGDGIENLRALIYDTSEGVAGIDVTFDLAVAGAWTLTAADNVERALHVGGAGKANALFTNGTLTANSFLVDGGTLTFGAGSVLDATEPFASGDSTSRMRVQEGGALRVVEGAVASMFGLYVITGNNVLLVDGTGSKLNITVTNIRSQLYNTAATVSNGAEMTVTSHFRLQAGSTLVVDNADVNLNSTDTGIHGGAVTIKSGGHVQSVGLWIGQAVGLNSNITVEAGSSFTSTGMVFVGYISDNYVGTLNVTGANATATVSALDSGGSWTNTTGIVNVENGGVLTVQNNMRLSPLETTSTSNVTVTGDVSRLVVNQNAYLGGDATDAVGAAFVTVADGGFFEVQELLKVYDTATLTLDSDGKTDTMVQAKTLTLLADSTLDVTLYGAQRTAGAGATGNALMWVTGIGVAEDDPAATITGAILRLTLDGDYVAELNDVFTLMQIDGKLTGDFDGYADGAIVQSGLGVNKDLDLRINYISNNDSVTLTVIPEPGVAGLLFAGVAGLIALRRRRG